MGLSIPKQSQNSGASSEDRVILSYYLMIFFFLIQIHFWAEKTKQNSAWVLLRCVETFPRLFREVHPSALANLFLAFAITVSVSKSLSKYFICCSFYSAQNFRHNAEGCYSHLGLHFPFYVSALHQNSMYLNYLQVIFFFGCFRGYYKWQK